MSIETGLTTLLLAQSAITSLVPAQVIGGITYPAICNEEPVQGMKPPFIVIVETGDEPAVCFDGTKKTGFATVTVACYHETKVGAKSISDAVAAFLNDYSGAAGATETIDSVVLDDRNYRKIYNADGTDRRQRISWLSYWIQHTSA